MACRTRSIRPYGSDAARDGDTPTPATHGHRVGNFDPTDGTPWLERRLRKSGA